MENEEYKFQKDFIKLLDIFNKGLESENKDIRFLSFNLIKYLLGNFTTNNKFDFLLVLNDSEEYKEIFNKRYDYQKSTIKIGNNSMHVRLLTQDRRQYQAYKIDDYIMINPKNVSKKHLESIYAEINIRMFFTHF